MITPKELIAVAIDFGTTYSGVTFMKVSSDRLPTQIGSWPGKPELSTRHKVPTVVAYPKNGDPLLWGFNAENANDSTCWKVRVFKPLLDPTYEGLSLFPPLVGLTDVVHDYLEGLYTHIVKFLKDEKNFHINTGLNFLLTVPAAFEDHIIEDFRDIIQTTGIGNHSFVIRLTEPEAASLYTIQTMQKLANPIHSDDCFIVCDAGGGTVDLSSYVISQWTPIRVRPTEVISGDYCGSTTIDGEFSSYVMDLMGEEAWGELESEKEVSMIKEFIRQKERFDNSTDGKDFNIFLGDIPCPGKKGQYLPISREQMQKFFAKSLVGIRTMIGAHIRECKRQKHNVKFIFLVGGLGSSPYVMDEVKKYFAGINSGIMVIQPQDPQQAVALGAISDHVQFLRGEGSVIEAQLCRANYGLVTTKPYDPNRDFRGKEFFDPISGEAFVKDQIKWLAYKGESITGGPEKCIEEELTRVFTECKEGKKCKNHQECKNGWEDVLVKNPGDKLDLPHCVEPGVKKVCRLALDLSSLPKSAFEEIKREKKISHRPTRYYRVRYTLKIHIGTVGVRPEMIYKGELRPDLVEIS